MTYRFHLVIDRLSVEKKYFEGEISFVIQDQTDVNLKVQELLNLLEKSYGCIIITSEV